MPIRPASLNVMAPTVTPLRRPVSRRRTVATIVIGNFVEYFDWLAFGLFAPLFATQFFPASNPVTSLLGAFAVLGVGMVLRPIGGVVLGRFSDRHGRKPALTLAIALMAAGSIVVAACPTHAQIGIAAPILLLLARAAHGFSTGGEWPSAVAYLRELAPDNQQVRYGSLFALSAASGAFTASLIGGALTTVLSSAQMSAWGWRVPFAVGAVLGIGLMIARGRLTETAVFTRDVQASASRGSLRLVVTQLRARLGLVVLFTAGLTAVVGTWTTAVPAMGHRLAGPDVMFWVVVTVTSVTIVALVPLGILADRIGASRFLSVSTLAFLAVGPYSYLAIDGSFASLVLAYGTGVVYMGCVTALAPKVLAGIFPPQQRTLGVGLAHATTTAMLGGLTPWLATYAGQHGAAGWFMFGIVATVVVGWAAGEFGTRIADRPAAARNGRPRSPTNARRAA